MITITMSDLNMTIKDRINKIKEKKSSVCCLQVTHFTCSDTEKLNKMKIYHANTNPKKAELAKLISNKAELRTRNMKDKGEHYKMTENQSPNKIILYVCIHLTQCRTM